jgi:nucleoside-diphosphate-sugar epimerase
MPDITKLQALTKWKPTTDLEEGLAKTVEYWMEQL